MVITECGARSHLAATKKHPKPSSAWGSRSREAGLQAKTVTRSILWVLALGGIWPKQRGTQTQRTDGTVPFKPRHYPEKPRPSPAAHNSFGARRASFTPQAPSRLAGGTASARGDSSARHWDQERSPIPQRPGAPGDVSRAVPEAPGGPYRRLPPLRRLGLVGVHPVGAT